MKSFGRTRERPLTQLERVSGSQSPSLVPTKVTWEISASTSKEDGDVDAAIAGEIKKSAARQLLHYELVARARVAGGAGRDNSSRQRCSRCRAPDRDNATALESDSAAAEGPLQRCSLERIPDDRINRTDCEQIHRASTRYTEGAGIPAAPVLYREVWR